VSSNHYHETGTIRARWHISGQDVKMITEESAKERFGRPRRDSLVAVDVVIELFKGKYLVIAPLVEPKVGYVSVMTLTELGNSAARDLMDRIAERLGSRIKKEPKQINSMGRRSNVWSLVEPPKWTRITET
jgi:hypothetical protein